MILLLFKKTAFHEEVKKISYELDREKLLVHFY